MKKIMISLVALLCVTALQAQRVVVNVPLTTLGQTRQMVQAAPRSTAKAQVREQSPRRVEGLSATQRAVGYAQGDSITLNGGRIGSAGTFPLGAIIGADILENYAGCKVVGIRFASAVALGRTRVFLYPVTDDGFIDETSAIEKTQRTYEGWNNIFFNGETSYEIQGDEELLVGYDYVETADMVAAETGGICSYGESSGSEFTLYGNFGSGEGWYSSNNMGCLCVQLIVDVSSLPEKDLDIIYFDSGFRYKQRGESVELYTVVANVGRSEVSQFTAAYRLDDGAEQLVEGQTLKEGANVTFQPTISLPDDIAIGKHQVAFYLKEADGETLGSTRHDATTVNFYVYANPLERQKVYVEQYTDQDISLSADVNTAFSKVTGVADKMVMVNVYAPDNLLAIPESNYLDGLYAYTRPSFTLNRAYFPGEDYIAYDINYYVMAYPSFVPGILGNLIAQDIASAAFATVDIAAEYDEQTRQLSVDVSGDLSPDAEAMFGDIAVTVLLTEDNVTAAQRIINPANNRETTNARYVHNHVLRQYVTSPIGDVVPMADNRYTGHFTTTLSDNWKAEDVKVVAFVTRAADAVTDDNVLEMDVVGANDFALSTIVSGINDLSLDPSQTSTPDYFTLDGRHVGAAPTQPGIYILRQGGQCRKVRIAGR